MQRKVVQIARKYLDKGYDDYQTEIQHCGPWLVMNWYKEDVEAKVRAFAKEVIEVIRGVDEADLFVVPTKEEAKRFLFDIMPGDLGNPENEDADFLADYHADYLIRWLRSLRTPVFWRGKRILERGEMPKE